MAQTASAPVSRAPAPVVGGTARWEEPDPRRMWQKYCSFADLSLREFMDIQEELLLEQIERIHESPLGRRLLRGTVPHSVAEFRANVPLTTYGDYAPFLYPGNEGVLSEAPIAWAHTTGAQADFKYVPYTQHGLERLLDNLMGAFIMAAARQRGEVQVWPGDTVLFNTPARPYVSGLTAFGMAERFGFRGVLDPALSEGLEFRERVRLGFREALNMRVDVIIAMTSVLVKVGEGFSNQAKRTRMDRSMLRPRALYRLGKALLKSKVLGRPVLPKDLWPTKAIIGWGVDTAFFQDQVQRYWGKRAFEIYACTEGGVMGMHTWMRQGMIFSPYADFFEFIPWEESLRSRADDRYRPQSVLLNEVQPGETYEIVISNFYGMPFVRYRVGHLVQFLAPSESPEAGELPQFAFLGRADDRIDLAGFTRVDEKTVWEALGLTGLDYEEWAIRKEFQGEDPLLHLYIELRQGASPQGVEELVHEKLKEVDPFYGDLERILGIRPLRVTCLPPGSFDRFYEERLKAGYLLGRRRPPRMNATDEDIGDLLKAAG